MYYSLADPKDCIHERVVELLKRSLCELPMAADDLQALEGVSKCSEICPDHAPSKEGKAAEAVGS